MDMARFMAKVDLGPGCWTWTGAQDANGYGRFSMGGRAGGMKVASRAAYELWFGPIPEGLNVLRSCGNGHLGCVRPFHLSVGTQSQNLRDAVAHGTYRNGNTGKTHCKRGHALAGSNLYVVSTGARRCKECSRAILRKSRAKARQAAKENDNE